MSTAELLSEFPGSPAVAWELPSVISALQVAIVAAAAQAGETTFDDAPDEFMDPISCEIMTDPVLLPTSKTVRGLLAGVAVVCVRCCRRACG